ncbi:transglutaminase domain-containing protein [Marinifilum fragile]|uniref:transglutaminase domain-containing protein n=1 Tax=Marinifilum fragile TaxID=570161 RepID=UPI002AA64E93|nr:transglutaminase domain-containing protein [Marinifilum fragile]
MDRKLIVILLLSFIPIALINAQESRNIKFSHIDRHVRKTPDSVANNIINLHNYLIEPTTNQTEAVRAFYFWIIKNIKYKNQIELLYDPKVLFYIGSNNCSSPVCVLKRRKAVCEGFSRLFQYFCDQSGIECYSISGYITKNGALQDRATHAWNVAKVDGVWFCFDLSWANAILEYTGIKSQANEFFMAMPEEFINTHLPLIPMWQFLKNPVPLEVFNAGEVAIIKHLNEAPENYNFIDSILEYNKLTNAKRRLKTADEIYRVNPANKFNLAMEYYRFARIILNYEGDIDALQYYYFIKARKKLTKAIELFSASTDISSKIMRLQSMDNLRIVERIIEQESENFIFLD